MDNIAESTNTHDIHKLEHRNRIEQFYLSVALLAYGTREQTTYNFQLLDYCSDVLQGIAE
jgi:hypothetical protein